MLTPEIISVLELSPLLQGVSVKLLTQKLSESELRILNSGEVLLELGQPCNFVYIILSGRLSIQAKDAGVDAMLGEAECVGESCVIGDVYFPASVVAATDCKLLAINPAALWELINSSHQAALNLLTVLNLRVRPANQTMADGIEKYHGFSVSSMIDELTGLYNRQWIEEKIFRYLSRHIYDQQPNCLMRVAIDHFKEFDQKYGQLGSEQVLRDVAYTMLSCLRPGDQAGHFTTEQFVVFLPDTTLADGCIAAERLRVAIAEALVVLPSGDALPNISVSIGVSQTDLDDTPANLLARADESLQQALVCGGDCVKWWLSGLKSEAASAPPISQQGVAMPSR
jgi:diguanylate cyclase (GGDEF)-like protein